MNLQPPSSGNESAISNAQLVLPGKVALGSVLVRNGHIVAVDTDSKNVSCGQDINGDYLIPGLFEMHTDNLGQHLQPRPKVSFPRAAAILAHDAVIAAAGITTVLNAISVGDIFDHSPSVEGHRETLDLFEMLRSSNALRAEHFLHARCELGAANFLELFEPFARSPRLRLISLMDHTPGQRQWREIEYARRYYTIKNGWTDAEFLVETRGAQQRQEEWAEVHRRWLCSFGKAQGVLLASHDDTTTDHVDEACSAGASICEFPTTLAAARYAKNRGLVTVAGAPNLVLGGSQSGNVSAFELIREGVLDVLSSDYVPASLLEAAWLLTRRSGFTLPEAIGMASLRPARACGFNDRGAIQVGLRADLVRIQEVNGLPIVREVWRCGERVL